MKKRTLIRKKTVKFKCNELNMLSPRMMDDNLKGFKDEDGTTTEHSPGMDEVIDFETFSTEVLQSNFGKANG
jgi:hypothetical protein